MSDGHFGSVFSHGERGMAGGRGAKMVRTRPLSVVEGNNAKPVSETELSNAAVCRFV